MVPGNDLTTPAKFLSHPHSLAERVKLLFADLRRDHKYLKPNSKKEGPYYIRPKENEICKGSREGKAMRGVIHIQ